MIIISYDIVNNKLRTKFAKFLKKFGHRLQYSVFNITNSEHILDNVESGIKNTFEPKFGEQDSVMIFRLSQTCKITRYGHARHDEEDVIML